MKTGFKDILKVNEKATRKNPWNFDQPPYDERTSCFVNAGTCFDTGTPQPIGTTNNKGPHAIPMGRVDTMKTFHKRDKHSSTNIDVTEE
jgi:hypothetical protein